MTWGSRFMPTDIPDPATGEPLYVWAKVRPRWYWLACRVWLFLGIVWRRIDTRIPDRLGWRTAWDVAGIVHP